MMLVDSYIIRQIAGAFAMVIGILTGIVWLTSTLRQLELLVTQGQGFFAFFGITLLILPLLIALIAPFATFIAFLFVLNKLNTDSELIVLSASGMSQQRLLRPMLFVALSLTAFAMVLTTIVVPATLRELRERVTAARADLIGQVIQPGRFTTVDAGLTFHVRDRGPGGVLFGVFVSDTRDPQLEMTYLGARGIVSKTDAGTFLILEQGQILRKPTDGSYASIIVFDSYAFNLSALVGSNAVANFSAQERSTWNLVELLWSSQPDRRLRGTARSELNDRFATPLYVLAFALVAFAALGRARTTRQSRTESVAIAIGIIVAMRIAGFFASGLAQREPAAVFLIYLIPMAGIIASLLTALGGWPRRMFAGFNLRLPGLEPALARLSRR